MASNSQKQSGADHPWIPEGYVIVAGPDDQSYVVPEFMVPAIHQVNKGHQNKQAVGAFAASGSVSTYFRNHCRVTGAGDRCKVGGGVTAGHKWLPVSHRG